MYQAIHPFKMYNSRTFSIFTEWSITTINFFRTLLFPQKTIPYFHPPQPQKPINLLLILRIFLFWTFHVNKITYRWSLVTGFFSLKHHDFKVHPYCSRYRHYISFYCQMTFHCTDIPHFIHPFISWWMFGLFPLVGGALLWHSLILKHWLALTVCWALFWAPHVKISRSWSSSR